MTMDGGLERLVRILHDFCICPPSPENPMLFYGLSPPSAHPPKRVPTLNPKSFDKQAQYRFALAFQCVVNIGVRGSESIRSRVVQAGTLDVVGCILEAWLAGRGFAVGPSVSASGMPRESKEQRLARRQAQLEARNREQAEQLARALQQQVIEPSRRLTAVPHEDEITDPESSRNDTPVDSSANPTPGGTNTPTGTVVVPGRERSGTVIARPTWEQTTAAGGNHGHTHHRRTYRRRDPPPESAGPSTSTSADNSRPETETEDDGDVDMDRESIQGDEASTSGTPPPERRLSVAGTIRAPTVHARRAVGIVSDTGNPAAARSLDMDNDDVHIVINDQGEGGVGGVGVEDGLVSLETNDDFAMGAPPGAPGAIDGPPARIGPDPPMPGERTPRAPATTLPHLVPITVAPIPNHNIRVTTGDPAATRTGRTHTSRGTNTGGAGGNAGAGATGGSHGHHHHARESEGPYRDEDVLLSLQLLAYLSKYPHVRQAFYKPRTTFHPATAQLSVGDGRFAQSSAAGPSNKAGVGAGGFGPIAPPSKEPNTFIRAYNSVTGRGKEKAPAGPLEPVVPAAVPPTPQRMTNVFALVERFTFRHSSADLESSNPPPSLPPEIQYWAGVIMRNACRKDDSRGGIRQCANMLCGRWESFPREFAKCRRCRKAKYCGKECQSLAWSEGHRFWCSAKDPEEDGEHHGESSRTATTAVGTTGTAGADGATPGGRHARRDEARLERERLHAAGGRHDETRELSRAMVREHRREQVMAAARVGATIVRPGAPPIIDLTVRDGVMVVNAGDGPLNDGEGPAPVDGNPDDMMLG
ncbi:hypothetical protein DAEQUDRAFT_493749 [Daedalea quercina L-15889]|uniref:MYND-type domain-containing protein n=1 Tax=Daedalea quercina L-15889 TaxID=1314783 RepID=A0A165MMM8_9APHY|nr:hypothetical protein DAEQUDRAFT_493749 [Daedalea quercina L-15889]